MFCKMGSVNSLEWPLEGGVESCWHRIVNIMASVQSSAAERKTTCLGRSPQLFLAESVFILYKMSLWKLYLGIAECLQTSLLGLC